MAEELENENSTNLEADEATESLETTEEVAEEATDDVEALKEQNRQLFARAKKAEGFIQKDGKWIKRDAPVKKVEPTVSAVSSNDDVDARVNAVLEKRELEALDVSDDLKKQIATFAKVSGLSVKQALKSDYIQFLKDKEETNADRASLPTGRKGATRSSALPNINTIDPRTPEGAKALQKIHEENRKRLG